MLRCSCGQKLPTFRIPGSAYVLLYLSNFIESFYFFFFRYKKYHRDTIKKSIKSLYKRKGKETGGQEWVCTHCDLTFDNPSLLNLHTLTHAAEDIGKFCIYAWGYNCNAGPTIIVEFQNMPLKHCGFRILSLPLWKWGLHESFMSHPFSYKLRRIIINMHSS